MVDKHSQQCHVAVSNKNSFNTSSYSMRSSQFRDEEYGFKVLLQECNEKIFKIIQTFLRKLESQNLFDRVFDAFDHSEEYGGFGSTGGGRYVPMSNATSIAEERSLIHEVIQSANLALLSDIESVQVACERLDMIDDDGDLNNKFEFNNHMLYNRLVQIVNSKLEAMQDFIWKDHPDADVPLTSK